MERVNSLKDGKKNYNLVSNNCQDYAMIMLRLAVENIGSVDEAIKLIK